MTNENFPCHNTSSAHNMAYRIYNSPELLDEIVTYIWNCVEYRIKVIMRKPTQTSKTDNINCCAQ